MKERSDYCPTPTFALKRRDMKLFHMYCILLSIKQLEKKIEILESKLALSIIKEKS